MKGSIRAAALFLLLPALVAPPPARAEDAFTRAREAFAAGRYEEAARAFEEPQAGEGRLLRLYNAGVSWLYAGKLDEAARRLEEVAAGARGELRDRALFNLGCARFREGKAHAKAAAEAPEEEAKLEALRAAAEAYRAAAEFFRSVESPDADCERNISVGKTALKAVLDEIRRIEEDRRRREDEEALKDPARLLARLARTEKIHRGLSRALARSPRAKQRLAARRLRRAEARNRALTEKLRASLLRKPPEKGAGAGPAAPPPPDEEKRRRLGDILARAIERQKEAELAYARLDTPEAADRHGAALEELRAARALLPLDLALLVREAIAAQEGVNAGTEALGEALAGGAPLETRGSGFGKTLVDALKDKVLMPLGKLLSPERKDDFLALAEEEEDVVWACGVLRHARLEPPQQPQGGAKEGRDATADTEKINEVLEREAPRAAEASERARAALVSEDVKGALAAGKEALEALRRIEEALPKPPRSLEERLAELILREREAGEAARALEEAEPAARESGRAALAESQRGYGREAESIAKELESRNDERARNARPKVAEGAEHIHASAEALDRDRIPQAASSSDEAVRALEEALAILSGRPPQGQEGDREERRKQKSEKEQKQGEDKRKEKERGAYALTPRLARMLREEMDRKRREEEAKLLAAPSSLAVEKDW